MLFCHLSPCHLSPSSASEQSQLQALASKAILGSKMMSLFRAAAHSVTNGALRGGASGFMAQRAPVVCAPLAPARPYRYTPPVQVGIASVVPSAHCAAPS